jgi:hypothetical protein
MADAQNWRTDVNAEDYFVQQKKQLMLADRRPVIRRASDLVGPGIGGNAIQVSNFNDPLLTFNGYFSYAFVDEATSIIDSAPNFTDSFVGFVTQDAELGGTQIFYSLNTTATWKRVFMRNPMDAASIFFGPWVHEAEVVLSGIHTFNNVLSGTDRSYVISLTGFPIPPVLPVVTVSSNYSTTSVDSIGVSASSISASGFRIRVRNGTGSDITALPVAWVFRCDSTALISDSSA